MSEIQTSGMKLNLEDLPRDHNLLYQDARVLTIMSGDNLKSPMA